MRHPHPTQMIYIIGFVIALVIGLTGVGGGTITVPVLILFLHMAPVKTVGTALLFTAAVKLLVAPVYLYRKQVNFRVFADRKSTRLNSSHLGISYAVFCLKKKTK